MRLFSRDGSRFVTDERFNTISHTIAAIFSLLGAVLLIVESAIIPDVWKIVAFSIYGFSLFFLFVSSSLHHGVNLSRRGNNTLRKLDYVAVFLLIGGTITPFCLVVLRNHLGWSIFGVTWAVIIFGVLLTSIKNIIKWFNLALYLTIGWFGAIIALLSFSKLSGNAILLLVLGGVAYTIGSIIFYIERPNFLRKKFGFHELWHIFVIIGALLHWFVMYVYILNI